MKAILQNIKSTAHIWSNAVFPIAGAASGSLEIFFAFLLLGITSFIAHWKRGDWWEADWAGMYIAFTAIILVNFGVGMFIFPLTPFIIWLTYTKLEESTYFFIGTLWIVSVFSAYVAGTAFLPALVAFALAYYLRQRQPNIDRPGYNLFHSLWHVFAAIGMYLLVKKWIVSFII